MLNHEQNSDIPTGSLGHAPVPETQYKADIDLLDRYQSVSAELIRLSLLGIAALGFFLKDVLIADHAPKWLQDPSLRVFIGTGSFFFALCAFAGLLHRYYSSDGLYYHIKEVRLLKDDSAEPGRAKSAAHHRNSRYKFSGWCLFAATILLGCGGVCLAIALSRMLWLIQQPICPSK